MCFKEIVLCNKSWSSEKVTPKKSKCLIRERFFFRLKELWFLVAFVILSSHIKLAAGEYKPIDYAEDSENAKDSEGFFQNNYKTCKKGLKLPGYVLNGSTKAGEYINLGSVNTFNECVDLCCQDSDCEIAVKLTHKEQQKCFKVVCFEVDNDLCKPVRATKQKEKYHPFLFLRGGTKEFLQKEGVDLSSSFSTEALLPLLVDKDVQARLQPFIPAVSTLTGSENKLREAIQSPQFKEALSIFSTALQSGELAPLMQQFKLSQAAADAATKGDIIAFTKALQESESSNKQHDSIEDMALN